ncbi:MAG: formylglycine-generating enzyme family protein [Halopseudomonas sp.]
MRTPNLLCLALLLPVLSWAAPQAGSTKLDSESGITFVYIPSGCFNMGSSQGNADEQPEHQVCLEQGLWLGQTEVTQAQYLQVMGSNPSKFDEEGDNYPVERISWRKAAEMAEKLSTQTGKRYRLPSEAEWEYACTAAGQHDNYCGKGEIDDLAWYIDNSDETSQPVGEKEPNAWGLMDMSGNVREWLQDCWSPSYQGAPTDGSAWTSGDCNNRVLRGGSWSIEADKLRSTNRNRNDALSPSAIIGFRIALEP